MAHVDAMWTTKDGRQILVSDMDDTHVLRTIRLLTGRLVDLGLQIPKNGHEAMLRDFNIEETRKHLDMFKLEAENRKLGDWSKFGVTLVEKVLD